MLQVPTRKFESQIKQTLLAGVKLNIHFFMQQKFTQKRRLASANWDMNRVVAIQKNRMSLDWFSADFLCQQSPWTTVLMP